jgi:putative ABC transport system permease protein
VLTESEAIRQFGTADALGKLLSLGAGPGKRDYRVTGVLRDLPRNTSLRWASCSAAIRARPPISALGQFQPAALRQAAPRRRCALRSMPGFPAWEKRASRTR